MTYLFLAYPLDVGHNQTVDATYAANGNSSEYTIVSVYEMGKISVHHYFFTIQKEWNSLCSLFTNYQWWSPIISKKQRMQTLNQDVDV